MENSKHDMSLHARLEAMRSYLSGYIPACGDAAFLEKSRRKPYPMARRVLIYALASEGFRQTDIADALNIERTTVSRYVDEMKSIVRNRPPRQGALLEVYDKFARDVERGDVKDEKVIPIGAIRTALRDVYDAGRISDTDYRFILKKFEEYGD